MSAIQHGVLPLPVARMGLAPLLDVSAVLRIPEGVAVGRFAKPTLLAGQFAGMAAGGFAAIALAVKIAGIGEEELAATSALTSLGPGTHRERKPTPSRRELKQNQRREEGPGRKKEEAFWREEVEEKAREENTISNRRF